MNREQYMKELNRRLDQLDIEGKEEIINDFNNHFEMGHQDGFSDEDLIESLGSIDEVLGSYENANKTNPENIFIHGRTQKKEFINKITTVDISARHANTRIRESKDGGIHVDYYKEGKLLERLSHTLIAYQEESVFFVKVLPVFPYRTIGEHELIVEVPNNLEKLIIGSSSGDIDGKNLNINKFRIQSASGDLSLDKIQSNEITIEVASSEIQLSEIVGDLSITTASGDVHIDQVKGNNFSYKAASGDLKLAGDYENIKLTNVSGDVDAQLKTIKKMIVTSTSGDIGLKVDNNNDFTLETRSLSGECSMNLKGKNTHLERNGTYQIGEPNCHIKLNTLSGDIHIDMD